MPTDSEIEDDPLGIELLPFQPGELIDAILPAGATFSFSLISGARTIRRPSGSLVNLEIAPAEAIQVDVEEKPFGEADCSNRDLFVEFRGDKGTVHKRRLTRGLASPVTFFILPMVTEPGVRFYMCSNPACSRHIPRNSVLPLGSCDVCASAGRTGKVFRYPK